MIKEVSIDEIELHVWPLFKKHREELTVYKDLMILKPDMPRYRAMEEAGILLILAAYNENELIGYSVNFVGTHLHYADLVVCNNDILYLDKEYRKSKIGYKLIKETERLATERGAKLMLWHSKPNTALSDMLPKMDCVVQDIIYSKVL